MKDFLTEEDKFTGQENATFQPPKGKKSVFVIRIEEFIEAGLAEPPLSLVAISAHMKMPVSSICIRYRRESGRTIQRAITEYRITRSRELLCRTDMGIREVAEAVGYSDSDFFIRVFKNIVGMEPQEYREKSSGSNQRSTGASV